MKKATRAVRAYWWNPRREPKPLLSEVVTAGPAWASAAIHGGHLFNNFGDSFAADLLHWITSRPVQWCSLDNADVISTGSVIERSVSHSSSAYIFGSGLRGPTRESFPIDAARIIGVRGRLTSEALGLPGHLAMGDPGLLCSQIYGLSARQDEHSVIALVPHFRMFHAPDFRRIHQVLSSRGEVKVVNPTRSAREVAAELASSRIVVSASLHGIIFADSLGVPVVAWSQILRHGESDFKYSDYSSMLGHSLIWASSSQLVEAENFETVLKLAESRSSAIQDQLSSTCSRIRSRADVLRALL